MCNDENRCSEASDAGFDARVADASPDAAGVRMFDIAYPEQWTFSVNSAIGGYFMVVNTSDADINMNSLEVKSIDDDSVQAIVRVTANPSDTVIPPGGVGGYVTPLSANVLINSGLVTEPRYDETSDYLTLGLQDAPNGTYDIHVSLDLALEGVRFSMPMTIHWVTDPTVYADPVIGTGKRRIIYRAP